MSQTSNANRAVTAPTLVLLAAGMGSRYGGLKQLESFGPGGATIMDYSIYDALRAGFERVVFVIRRDIADEFRRVIGSRYEGGIAVDYAFQQLDDLPGGQSPPAGRTKPWGTGQAVLAAREVVAGPFAVANADDFYGASSFAALAAFLRAPADETTWAMVAYRLRDTLSEGGAVSRGLCRPDAAGWLQNIVETTGIEPTTADAARADGVVRAADGESRVIPGDQPVSMNLWAFRPRLFALLGAQFERFLTENAGSEKAEFYLPSAIQALIDARIARVQMLTSRDRWCGVTHRADRPHVEAMITELVERGAYPRTLWT